MRLILYFLTLGCTTVAAQQSDLLVKLQGGTQRAIAITDFKATGDAQKYMDVFNKTVWDEVQGSGLFKMSAKSFYPLDPPQRPADLRPAAAPAARSNTPAPLPANCNGRCLTDWSAPPVEASYLAFGYGGVQNNQIVILGHLFNTTVASIQGAQLIAKFYLGTLDEAGARKTAQEFAADILAQMGGISLAGSKIYFVSDRTGSKEIWAMDYDGSNQHTVTNFKSITITPTVSADGSQLAFTTYAKGTPRIYVWSVEGNRVLPFLNPQASMNATPCFSPDGKKIAFSSTLNKDPQIYIASNDGGNMERLSTSRAVEVEPKINPKTGAEIVFTSGRGGPPQVYKMNLDGADLVRLTDGEGEAVNPAWHPDGQHIAFAWTRGFAPGNRNIFIMDVSTRETVQLTHGAGRNENPTWAPDGRHLVFASNRNGSMQIFTMLADGKEVRQLTTQGGNTMPVWGK